MFNRGIEPYKSEPGMVKPENSEAERGAENPEKREVECGVEKPENCSDVLRGVGSVIAPRLTRAAVSLNSVKSYVMVVAHSYQYVGFATSAFALTLVAHPSQLMMVNFYSKMVNYLKV